MPVEAPFEVATAYEEQLSVDPDPVKRAAVELGHGTCAGPFVGEDNHAHSHRQSIADRCLLISLQELGKAFLWG